MNYTITANPAFNSLEITFDGKPAQEVRDALKALKFRWHAVKKCWYGYTDENTIRAAIDGGKVEKTEKPTAKNQEINLSGIENNKKTCYGADFAKVLRADLKARGASGFTIRANRSGYTDSITVTIAVSADEFRSAEEAAARDGWDLFFRRENNYSVTVDGIEYSHWYNGQQTENKKYISCGSSYKDTSAESNFPILRGFWKNEIARFESINNHNMDRRNYVELTDSAYARISAIVAIIQSYNWDHSDSMTDYFDVGFYLDIDIKKPADFQPREFMTDAERVQLEKDLAAEEEAERERMDAWEREQEEARKEEERRAAQEAKDRAEIADSVKVEDLPESEQFYILGLLGGIGKESTIEELAERADRTQDALITRKVTFCNESALKKFSNMLLYDFDFISGKGGTGTNDPRVTDENITKLNREQREQVKFYSVDCIAVYLGDVLQFVVNPEGYGYARYCYIPTAETEIATPDASAQRTADEESAQLEPFYFPAPVTEQAAALHIGEMVTVYQTDGWILQNICTAGILVSAEPGNYAQYSGVFLNIQRGKKNESIFCHDGKETVVFNGLPLALPDSVKYAEVSAQSSGAVLCHCRDYSDELRQIINYYAECGRHPVLDTVQR